MVGGGEVGGVVRSATGVGDDVVDGIGAVFTTDVADGRCGEDAVPDLAPGSSASVPRHDVTPSAYRGFMAEHEEQAPIAPPPMSWRPAKAPGAPPNEFGQLVKRGFGLGVGIWLAFAALSAAAWFVLAVLFAVALSG